MPREHHDAAAIVVPFDGVIDLTTTAGLADVAELAAANSRALVLDLRAATALTADGVRGLLHTSHALEAAGSSLILRSPSGPVRAAIAMTGAADVLDIRD